MSIPRAFIDELTQRADIAEVVGAYVPLNRKGANLWGLCPFHSEKTASVLRLAGEADLPLLWLRQGRRGAQLFDGN